MKEKSLSVDEIIARAQKLAGFKPDETSPAGMRDNGAPLRAHGSAIKPLRDNLVVELRAGLGKVGSLFIPNITKDTRNQTYALARVLGRGPDVATVKTGDEVLVSEFFGTEIKLLNGSKHERNVRLGRERDIVGVVSQAGLQPVGDRIIMARIDPPNRVGMIFLPEDRLQSQWECRVLGAGPKCSVKLRDKILVDRARCASFQYEANDLLLIDEFSVLAIL